MTDKEKLFIIVNGIHHSKSATRDYILDRMYDVYGITYPRTNKVLSECIEDGSLLPDSQNGFICKENTESTTIKITEKLSHRKLVEYLSWIAGIMLAVFFLYDRFFK